MQVQAYASCVPRSCVLEHWFQQVLCKGVAASEILVVFFTLLFSGLLVYKFMLLYLHQFLSNKAKIAHDELLIVDTAVALLVNSNHFSPDFPNNRMNVYVCTCFCKEKVVDLKREARMIV